MALIDLRVVPARANGVRTPVRQVQTFLDLRQGGVLFSLPEGQQSIRLKRHAAQRRGCLHNR
jgi:hypothetical protein